MTFPPKAYNQQLIDTFRANNGKMPNRSPLLLLTTRGANAAAAGEPLRNP